jgi:hypothetical protein
MTKKETKTKTELLWHQQLQRFGEQKIIDGQKLTMRLLEQLNVGIWYGLIVLDAEAKKQLLTMKIMTNRWMLFGCASHVINNDIKN